MRGKFILLTGVAIGYVLGAKAGRGRYDQIKQTADKIWTDPRVQGQVDKVEEYVKDKAPEVGAKVSEVASKASKTVSSKAKKTSAKAKDAVDSADSAPANSI